MNNILLFVTLEQPLFVQRLQIRYLQRFGEMSIHKVWTQLFQEIYMISQECRMSKGALRTL